jgi:hypothetical protein
MNSPNRGEVWLVDLCFAARIRPASFSAFRRSMKIALWSQSFHILPVRGDHTLKLKSKPAS